MILPIIPLLHVFLGFTALAWGRSARATLIVGFLLDSAILGLYLVGSPWFEPILIGGWGRPIGIALAFDSVSLSFFVLAVGLEFAAAAYVWREKRRPYFFMLLNILFGSTYALIFAQDLFNIYVILELLTLTSLLLIAYDRHARQVWAGLKYLLFASFGMSLFLFGATIVYGHTGSFNLSDIQSSIAASPGAPWVIVSFALLFAGVAVKAGIFSFSLWLPAAHSSASTAVLAILSGLVIKMGVVVLIRLHGILPLAAPFLVLGALTGIIGATYAIASFDIKRLLAFSTLSQIGYLLIGLSLSGEAALTGVLAYVIAHGWFKGLLFLAAGEASRAVGSTKIPDLVGCRRRIPLAARLGLLVGTLGILGVPPLAGYIAKGALIASGGGALPPVLFALIGIVSAASLAKLFPLLLPRTGGGLVSPSILAALLSLSIPVLFFLPIGWRLFGDLLLRPAWSGASAWEAFGTIGVGLLLGWSLRRRALHLPQRIFRIEFGVVSILAGFIAVYALISLG